MWTGQWQCRGRWKNQGHKEKRSRIMQNTTWTRWTRGQHTESVSGPHAHDQMLRRPESGWRARCTDKDIEGGHTSWDEQQQLNFYDVCWPLVHLQWMLIAMQCLQWTVFSSKQVLLTHTKYNTKLCKLTSLNQIDNGWTNRRKCLFVKWQV